MEIEVKNYTNPGEAKWYATWERTAEGWGVLVVSNAFYFPGHLKVTWPNGKPTVPPPYDGYTFERLTTVEVKADKRGRVVVFDNLTLAEAYTHTQAKKRKK